MQNDNTTPSENEFGDNEDDAPYESSLAQNVLITSFGLSKHQHDSYEQHGTGPVTRVLLRKFN